MNPLDYIHYKSTRVAPSRGLPKPTGFILCLLMFPVFGAENYDLAILGGRVMDPASDFDEIANVGITGDRIAVHLRHTPGTETDEINGAQEILANAAALNSPAIINHFNNPGWQRVHELITRMQSNGHNVWGEIYPYAAGATTINAVFFDPSNWRDRLGRRYEETMFDPSTNEFLTERQYLSLRESDPTRIVVVFKNPEEEVVQWLGLDGISIASDGLPDLVPLPLDSDLTQLPNAHPRTAGTYAKALRLVRENKLSLMAILKLASTNSALHLAAMGLESMSERGKVQENAIADLVVFDPETVTDNSTYRKGTLPSTGFKAVLVSGNLVLEEDEVLLQTTAGKPIRFAPVTL